MPSTHERYRKVLTRNKLRTCPSETSYRGANRLACQAFMPNEQEVAQHCASSCPHVEVIVAQILFADQKNVSSH
jgi:hypothetical protein